MRASGAGGAGTGIPRAFQAFAGGLTVDGRWGVIGMDHLNHNKTLSGRKSWFFLDDAVVSLGAGNYRDGRRCSADDGGEQILRCGFGARCSHRFPESSVCAR